MHAFRSVKDISVDRKLSTDVLFALGLADGEYQTVLPSLHTFRISKVETVHESSLKSFMTSRQLSGRHVQLYVQEFSCRICDASFTEHQELKKHLVVMHAYRLVCPYCGDFGFSPRYSDLFREHLSTVHPEITHADTLIFNPASQLFSHPYPGSQGNQNSDLRATVNFEAFTKFRAPNLSWPQGSTDLQSRPNSVVHLLTSPYPTWLSEEVS